MAKIYDLREKLTPPWIRKGKAAMDKLQPEEQDAAMAFMFNLILADVRNGLAGEDNEIFFDLINAEFEKGHNCYFNPHIMPESIKFTDTTRVCKLCAIKLGKFADWQKRRKANEPV